MKKLILSAVAVLCGSFLSMAADREQMNITKLYLNGEEVTATAAQINAAVASSVVNTLAVKTNATVGGYLTVTGAVTNASTTRLVGVATFVVAPKVTVTTAVDLATGQTCVLTNLPATYSTKPEWVNVTIGSKTFLVPAFSAP